MTIKTLPLPLTLLLAAALPAAAADEACFTRFAYSGEDEYYAQNRLTSPHEFFNPVIPGWASDPSVCRVDSTYYLVTSTFGYFPGVPLYVSHDLVNWQLAGNILDRPSQLPCLQGQSLDRGGIYAPTIRYNRFNKTFYMITTDVGKGNFYVTARNPLGPWSDPVWLPDVDGIDPSFFFDDDGKAYIIHKEETAGKPKWNNHRSILIIRFDTERGTTVGPNIPFCEEGVGPEERLARDEGPHLYKVDGRYYVLCAEGGTSVFHSEVCYQADSVLGPYRRWPRNPMLTQRLLNDRRTNKVACAGHADLVQTPEGEWWAVFLATRPVNNGFENLGRETFLMPVKWSRDGFPYITQEKDTVPMRLTRARSVRQAGSEQGNFVWTDDFSASRLRPEWLMLWGDASAWYRLHKGLRLKCAPNTLGQSVTPAYVGRRLQHHRFSVEADMEFEPGTHTSAGLMLVKNGTRQYYLARNAAGMTLLRCNKGRREPLGSLALPREARRVQLRVVADGTTFAFFVRTGGGAWQPVAEGVDASFLSTRSAGGFTGTTIGMYAETADAPAR